MSGFFVMSRICNIKISSSSQADVYFVDMRERHLQNLSEWLEFCRKFDYFSLLSTTKKYLILGAICSPKLKLFCQNLFKSLINCRAQFYFFKFLWLHKPHKAFPKPTYVQNKRSEPCVPSHTSEQVVLNNTWKYWNCIRIF